MTITPEPITIKESCVELLQDLLAKSGHITTCALRQPFDQEKDGYPLCDCGHSDGEEAAWDLISILRGDGE
jgi:hypothetical protein